MKYKNIPDVCPEHPAASVNKVYVVNQAGNNLSVIDGSDFCVTATIAVGEKPCGVAVLKNTGKVYVSCALGKCVDVLAACCGAKICRIPLPGKPSGICADPVKNRIYSCNAEIPCLFVIDALYNRIVAKISLCAPADGVAVNPTTGRIYTTHPGKACVSAADGNRLSVVGTIAVGKEPYGIAVNPVNNTVYVADWKCENVAIIDGVSNQIMSHVPVPAAVGVDVNLATGLLYASSWWNEGRVSVVDSQSCAVCGCFCTGSAPYGVAVNPLTNTVFISTAYDGTVSAASGNINKVFKTIPTGMHPCAIAVNP